MKNENICSDILRFSECKVVNLYACIGGEEKAYKKIILEDKTSEALARHFTMMLEKTYCSEKKEFIEAEEFFGGNYYDTKRLRDKLVVLKTNLLPMEIDFSKINGTEPFSNAEAEKIEAFIIEYCINSSRMWLYQKHTQNRAIAVSRYLSIFNDGNVYKQVQKPDVSISTNIDAVIVNGILLSDNIDVLEKVFGLNKYTQDRAKEILESKIKKMQMLIGEGGLDEAVKKGDLALCRQIVKSEKSPVWKIKREELVEKVREIQTEKKLYQDLVITEDDKFNISSYKAKRSFMKLVNDEILTSVLTGVTYDVHGKKFEIAE